MFESPSSFFLPRKEVMMTRYLATIMWTWGRRPYLKRIQQTIGGIWVLRSIIKLPQTLDPHYWCMWEGKKTNRQTNKLLYCLSQQNMFSTPCTWLSILIFMALGERAFVWFIFASQWLAQRSCAGIAKWLATQDVGNREPMGFHNVEDQ